MDPYGKSGSSLEGGPYNVNSMQASKGGLVAQHSILLSSEHSDFSIDEKEKGHSLLDVKKSKKKPKGG